jgi:hypothetical protein
MNFIYHLNAFKKFMKIKNEHELVQFFCWSDIFCYIQVSNSNDNKDICEVEPN